VPVFGTSGNNASGRTVWANPAVQPGRRLCSQAQIIGQRWAPSWTPASLSPILWFDAATGITADAAGLVSQWNDRSATAAHAVQATGSSQPSSIAQSLNGYPVVTFGTGGIKTLVHSAQLAGTAYTAFYLLRATGESGVGATYYHAGSPSTGGLAFASELSVLGQGWGEFDGTNTRASNAASALNAWEIHAHSPAKLFKDGAEPTYAATSTITAGNITTIGSRADNVNVYFIGDIAEIVVFDTVLADTDRQLVEGYLAWKWGLQTQLPAAHPYATTPPVSSYSMAADAGVFAFSPQPAGLAQAVSLPAAVGTFSFSPQSALSEQGYAWPAAVATFALSPQAATLTRGYALAATVGTFAFSPQAVVLARGYALPAGQATFSLSPQAANLARGYAFTAANGVYTLSPQAAALTVGYDQASAVGTFSVSGQAVNLTLARRLSASFGTYGVVGQAAALLLGYEIPANAAIFSVAGQAARLTVSSAAVASAAVYAYTGQPTALLQGYTALISVGTFTVDGKPATLGGIFGSTVKAFEGGSFVSSPLMVRTLAGWIPARLKRWNGAAWVSA
jgi:hypothetical protein